MTTTVSHLLVIGYYDHHNLGDEQYKATITHLMERRVFNHRICPPTIEFVDCDKLSTYQMHPNTAILLGGGDVLNTYFLDKIQTFFFSLSAATRPVTLIAFSVGIPYNDVYLIPEQRIKLEMFDHIFLRTRQDMEVLQRYITSDKVHYLPDTSCFALEHIANTMQYKQALTRPFRAVYYDVQRQGRTHKIIGVMFCRHIYHQDSPYRENYGEIVREFASLLEELIKMKFFIVLVPFNTKPLKGQRPELNKENDVLIQRDVLKQIRPTFLKSVQSIDFQLTLEQTMLLYKSFYACIPMRFHATLFSVYSGVPMIPIYTTKKIRNFLLDIHWEYDCPMEKNAKDLPLKFDKAKWMDTFREMTYPATYLAAKKQLLNANMEFKRVSMEQVSVIRTSLTPSLSSSFVASVFALTESMEEAATAEVAVELDDAERFMSVEKYMNKSALVTMDNELIDRIYHKLQRFSMEHGVSDFRHLRDPMLQQVAASVVSYYLTGAIDSPYHHGMMEKMFVPNYPYRREWQWVWEHHRTRCTSQENAGTMDVVQSPSPGPWPMRFNLEYIDQNDQSGAHRSGWKYVYDSIRKYHQTNADLLLDLYVDRTFHWKRTIFRQIDIIPYTRPWMGFVHHTFDTEFSPYNNVNLLQCPEFLQSLACCRGILVLSKTLQQQFLQRLPMHVPVHVLTHPTETNVPQFQYSAFMANTDKKLVHIGGWLRNVFSFYQLVLRTSFTLVQPTSEWKKMASPTPSSPPTPLPVVVPILPAKTASSTPTLPTNQQTQCCVPWWKGWLCKKNEPLLDLQPLVDLIPEPTPVPPSSTPVAPNTPSIMVTTTTVRLRKVILKGKNMDNYFPPRDVLEQTILVPNHPGSGLSTPSHPGSNPSSAFCSTTSTSANLGTNNWIKHMMDYLRGLYHLVDVMDYMDNASYDELLTKNVVFLNLVDGSAINTLLECLVRNTPVFVNRHPAVVEVLGEAYPLYFSEPNDINTLLEQPQRVFNAHVYMKKIDKTPYKMETFLESLNRILTDIKT